MKKSALILLIALFILGLSKQGHAQITITDFSLNVTNSYPYGITSGPDGNIWFTEQNANKIGRITPAGVITEFPLVAGVVPFGITSGPDGNIWFVDGAGSKIGRMTTAGVITEFPLSSTSYPVGITAGPDGNVWFTETGTHKIGRITPSGVLTEFSIPTNNGYPAFITAGPDGNVWFTELVARKIGKITPAGVVTEFPIVEVPFGITSGPDGNLWFTETTANQIGRITPSGVLTEFTSTRGFFITSGSDGNLWFTDSSDRISRMTTSGIQDGYFLIPSYIQSGRTTGITSGPDGNIWYASPGPGFIYPDHIGRVSLPQHLYGVCALYDQNRPVKSGSIIPIKLQLCDGTGTNLSSSGVTLSANSIVKVSTSVSGTPSDAGNANPDTNFRFDPLLGGTGGYIFNLSTKGFSTGTYKLNFTVSGDLFVYSGSFEVK